MIGYYVNPDYANIEVASDRSKSPTGSRLYDNQHHAYVNGKHLLILALHHIKVFLKGFY